jgi:hypothetical protein
VAREAAAVELRAGSTNPAKIRQLAAALAPAGIRVHGVSDLAVLPRVTEDCADALGNARKKAVAFAVALERPCLAMDASLLLPDLDLADQPGVHVRRLAGATHLPGDDEVLAYCTRLCEQRGGRLRGRWEYGFAIGMPDGRWLDAAGKADRMLVAPPCARRHPGYPPATGRYLAESSEQEAAAHQAETIGEPLRELAGRAAAWPGVW